MKNIHLNSLLDKSPLPNKTLKNNAVSHGRWGHCRQNIFNLRIILQYCGIVFILFNFKLISFYIIFMYINFPIEVAGESCKKTIVDASAWKRME